MPKNQKIAHFIKDKNHKLQIDDKDALKCDICKKNMMLDENFHTIGLLFEFYNCKCSFNDQHVIVRDKPMNLSVVHESKAISRSAATRIRLITLSNIIHISTSHDRISQLEHEAGIDAPVDLRADGHTIAACKTRHEAVKLEADKVDGRQSRRQRIDIGHYRHRAAGGHQRQHGCSHARDTTPAVRRFVSRV